MKYVLEILVVLTTIGSWMRMYLTGGGSLLSSRGLMSLKYYTTLSNIFAGIAAVIMIVVLARAQSGKVS